jgi:acid phosphatase (class A)
MQIALRTGELQAIHYKYRFNRPRASTLAPWLMPPIEVPGHASFPSGHSTQSHLVALVLGEVMPAWARGKNGPLRQLALRIARNREVLGLHYPSDSKAGEKLAIGSFLLLRTCPTVKAMINAARKEWDTWGQYSDTSTSLADLGYGAA